MTTTSNDDAADPLTVNPLPDRAAGVVAAIERHERALTDLRMVRDALIREYRANTDLSLPAIADVFDVSVSTVKGALPREDTPRRPGRRPGRSSR